MPVACAPIILWLVCSGRVGAGNEVTLRTDPSKGLACVWWYYDAMIRRYFIQARQLLPLEYVRKKRKKNQFYATMRMRSRGQLTQQRCRAQNLAWCFACDDTAWPHAATWERAAVLGTLDLGSPKFPLWLSLYILCTLYPMAGNLFMRRLRTTVHVNGMPKYGVDLQKMEKN